MDTNIFTTADVAAQRGCTPTSVARVARQHGIGRHIGRDWIFSAAEATRLADLIRDGKGNPNFGRTPEPAPKKRRKKAG